jgi:hypothetical protein
MPIGIDGLLGLLGVVISLLVGGAVWWFSKPLLADWERKFTEVNAELRDLRTQYNALMLEYWRVIAENEWLRRQLRARDINIPPLPDDLKPRADGKGNITIMVTDRVGVQVAGGSMQVGQDFIGGDKATA